MDKLTGWLKNRKNPYLCDTFSKTAHLQFDIFHRDNSSSARAGVLVTDHGSIETPFFMPVGTAGVVKALHVKDLREEVKAQIMLSNTYHLYLRPGVDIISRAGGLHKFNGWNKPILTDSGGYQIY